MGLTRKTMSVFTLGAIDFRSDKERTAAYTRDTRKELQKQTKIMESQIAKKEAISPPGWYPDPNGLPVQRYWDGQGWTPNTT